MLEYKRPFRVSKHVHCSNSHSKDATVEKFVFYDLKYISIRKQKALEVCLSVHFVRIYTVLKVWEAATVQWKGKGGFCSFCSIQHFMSNWANFVSKKECLVLFKPRRTIRTRHFQLDVELLECLFQLLLVSSIIGSYGIMEQDELVVQHLHL